MQCNSDNSFGAIDYMWSLLIKIHDFCQNLIGILCEATCVNNIVICMVNSYLIKMPYMNITQEMTMIIYKECIEDICNSKLMKTS
jgi:hypothetical protein